MARTFPVPFYSTTGAAAGFPTAQYRALSTASPGTTESTATTTTYALASGYRSLQPEASNTAESSILIDEFDGTTALLTARRGFILDPVASGLIPTATDGMLISAGTWTINFPTSRSGGLTDGDVTNVIRRAALYTCAIQGANLFIDQLIGSVAAPAATVSTGRNTAIMNLAGALTELKPGQKILMLFVWEFPLQVSLSGTMRCHTNATTGARITAAPDYTIQYSRTQSESASVTETHTRRAAYTRPQNESSTVTEAHHNFATYRRYKAELVPTPGDLQTRQVAFVRPQNESVPTPGELHLRNVVYTRKQNEVAGVTEAHTRQVSYVRVQNELLSSGGGSVTKVYRPIILAE